MSYAAWSVIAGEQPTTVKWNILGTNDASFNDGTGIANATITASKLATGAASAAVATSETTASVSYVGLTTPQTVTVTVGANGLLLVIIGATISNSGANASFASFALSGANTLASSDARSIINVGSNGVAYSRAILLTGLAAGSTVVTAQFRASAGTGTFVTRDISVVPL